jgi:Na+-transporting methylmalonyl-CoA/oxaloacetate decarboxylase gamma subunit
MDVALIIIIAVLFLLAAIVTLKGRRGRQAAREQEQAEAGVRAGEAEAQHGESQRRQAGVRAAHAERASKVGSDTDE